MIRMHVVTLAALGFGSEQQDDAVGSAEEEQGWVFEDGEDEVHLSSRHYRSR